MDNLKSDPEKIKELLNEVESWKNKFAQLTAEYSNLLGKHLGLMEAFQEGMQANKEHVQLIKDLRTEYGEMVQQHKRNFN